MVYFLAMVGLSCGAWAFSGCREQGLLSLVVCGLLTAVAPLVEYRPEACGLQWLQYLGSVVAACRLSCSVACWIIWDEGLSQCPLH